MINSPKWWYNKTVAGQPETGQSQKKIVNNYIVPIVQKAINKKAFPVSDGIIKHIIHERHRHQRENNNNKRRRATWNDQEQRRKHANTRC
jgi:hypothetical protein